MQQIAAPASRDLSTEYEAGKKTSLKDMISRNVSAEASNHFHMADILSHVTPIKFIRICFCRFWRAPRGIIDLLGFWRVIHYLIVLSHEN